MDPSERRSQILMAAKRLFANNGYHATGVADIIEEAGIARGTFYLYFKSKRDIFTALMDYIIQEIVESLEEIPKNDPLLILQTLLGNIERFKKFFFEQPDYAKIFIKEATALDADSSERFLDIRRQLASKLSDLVKEWQKVGILRPLNSEIIAYAFIGAIKELMEQSLVSGYLSLDKDKTAESLMDLLLFGIIAPEHNKLVVDHLKDIGSENIPRGNPKIKAV